MYFGRDRVFKRQFEKLDKTIKEKFEERLILLMTNVVDPLLNDHKLGPPFESYRSINITGDYRLVYKRIDVDTIYLRAIGTHHQLYGT